MPSIRLISRNNGVGLSRDLEVMAEALDSPGSLIEVVGFGSTRAFNWGREASLWVARGLRGRARTQIFSERVYPRCLPLGQRNLLVPNPEWFLPKWHRYLGCFEQVLCKTRHAEAVFRRLGCRTRYIGFTSRDRYDPQVARRHAFFHLAGRSAAKGTQVLLETWKRHPEWPTLTVVQHPKAAREVATAANIDHRVGYLDDAGLRHLQNAHAFHICPSETEGFGHYLMEAMSTGAVAITTDAEPMNELVTHRRGILIVPAGAHRNGLVRSYRVDAQGIETAVSRALALSPAQRWSLACEAREFFLANDRAFRQRLRSAVLSDGCNRLTASASHHLADDPASAIANDG
ncbi:glycosyltransferase [Pseudoxanthomonas wuyuanensis]|uniref:Glycosyltransferase involved in cell wall bisynthesis n=1 Tax=Pseudoxanthomonas wuyuanensis TaxID=1073196 RepID=A0A286DA78_9GAMM|nr:glycosyltransferase [Pseudoxanthomonas wuyuanensis]KAF1720530.1 glycosyltransferase [Pseudoxanthomonas wuyuanensis]SOD55550.1 Glycosyltransferase involved in cell wall bisynthesis [Pseudoxanthomonas wuyuanensis]